MDPWTPKFLGELSLWKRCWILQTLRRGRLLCRLMTPAVKSQPPGRKLHHPALAQTHDLSLLQVKSKWTIRSRASEFSICTCMIWRSPHFLIRHQCKLDTTDQWQHTLTSYKYVWFQANDGAVRSTAWLFQTSTSISESILTRCYFILSWCIADAFESDNDDIQIKIFGGQNQHPVYFMRTLKI